MSRGDRHVQAHKQAQRDHVDRLFASREAPRESAEHMRIGYSQTERAEKLGVDRLTVVRWDEEEPLVVADTTTSGPTHAIDKRGRPQPTISTPAPRFPPPERERATT